MEWRRQACSTFSVPLTFVAIYAAGAMYSTADDLLAFANDLFGGRLVNAESLKLMVTPGLPATSRPAASTGAKACFRTP